MILGIKKRLGRRKTMRHTVAPTTAATPTAPAPSAAAAPAFPQPASQQRRGIQGVAPVLNPVGKGAKVAVAAAGVGGGILLGGWGVKEATSGIAAMREANRARLELAPVSYDADGDGIPDGTHMVPFVLGPDGAFSSYGAAPTFTDEGKPTGGEDLRETAKTLGLVVVGVLVVGGIVYVVTRPGVAQKLGRAFT